MAAGTAADDRDPALPSPVADLACVGVSATPPLLDQLRRQLTAWAGCAGLPAGQSQDLVLAVYEALANVVVHAYPGEPGTLDLHAHRHGSRVTVTVTDRGRWRPAPAPGLLHGRGLPLIHTLADESAFTTTPAGTVVEMSWTCAPVM
ncbi:ATP-binding protein [Amycolatopsis sp. CA-126428]|uniref:ATP-binding protein n=1 Tax=Amycolatopsis sp. CA-126428 TaxID=2073158 RepID=UPI000CD23538|nr:ATP-binding protein [Amycolatopsis sp. CA-126428]